MSTQEAAPGFNTHVGIRPKRSTFDHSTQSLGVRPAGTEVLLLKFPSLQARDPRFRWREILESRRTMASRLPRRFRQCPVQSRVCKENVFLQVWLAEPERALGVGPYHPTTVADLANPVWLNGEQIPCSQVPKSRGEPSQKNITYIRHECEVCVSHTFD